jgi:hypothetical protein
MSKVMEDTFGILLEPHELTNIRDCIMQKLNAQKGTYLHQKQYYLDDILELRSISPFGMTSRTNHLISFHVEARISYVRPCVGDVVTGTVSSVIKHGTFVQTSLYTSIVPTPQQASVGAVVAPREVGDIVAIRIDDVKFSARHIYTISSFVDSSTGA